MSKPPKKDLRELYLKCGSALTLLSDDFGDAAKPVSVSGDGESSRAAGEDRVDDGQRPDQKASA
ncbi:hypothetical protein N8642_03310 [bacterium]|jgi:hypothetical protein|nr:hypothetical protein [bacterium]